MANNLIDFIGIGVQKSATTWLYNTLVEHPEINGVKGGLINKEVNFFNRNYHLGYEFYNRKFDFEANKIGEFSTLYFCDSSVPEKIYKYNPKIKLILMLRDPLERAFSQHKFQFMKNRLTDQSLNFENAIKLNPSYLEQGLYSKHLANWLVYFSLSQIHIIFYDDIKNNQKAVIKNVLKFLDVDENCILKSRTKQINKSYSIKNHQVNNFYNWIGGKTPRFILENIRKLGLIDLLKSSNHYEIEDNISPMSKETRKELKSYFKNDIETLEKIVSRDLSQWK